MSDIVVLKVGGSLGGHHLDAVVTAIRCLRERGKSVVVVHGGGPRITEALEKAKIEATFMDGQRVTSAEAMEVVERVLAKEINPEMVRTLSDNEIQAVGFTGSDGILFATPVPNLMQVGRVRRVHVAQVVQALQAGTIPVIAPVGCDDQGVHYNINADLAASALAGSLSAERVVFLTDVPGIYSDFAAKELLRHADIRLLTQLRAESRFSTGMIPKVEAVLSAVSAGVGAAYVVHGADAGAVLWGAASLISESDETAKGTRVVAS